MSKILKLSTIIIALFLCFGSGKANNLEIGIPLVVERNTSEQYVKVQFDISWDNSWRTSEEPNNYDGIWLFVKYKKVSDGNWYHATLNTENNSTGSQGTAATLQVRSDSIGAMFYRSADGTGTFSSTNVKLCWNYGADSLTDNIDELVSEYKVFGIEMVYVPEGAFQLGSGGQETCRFITYPNYWSTYQVTSENAINVGTINGYLYYDPSCDAGGDGAGPIPAAFPKGYAAFWCMKYEITQEQYVDFLNTLTRAQQNTRTATNIIGTSITRRYVMRNSSSMSYRNGIRCDANLPASPTSVVFYCDFNGNGIPNEADDGQDIACNCLSWADGVAYSDWSGMRPMTELEFEKACHGTVTPVEWEYAWGNTTITQASAVSNSGTENESVSSGNCNYWTTINPNMGPIRVGIFATTNSTRFSSGSSYYGIMELSGNLWERPVTVGNPSGRAFTGILGDGNLDTNGNANVTNWPGTNAVGSGSRGGTWSLGNYYCQVYYRVDAARTSYSRSDISGFRCCISSVAP